MLTLQRFIRLMAEAVDESDSLRSPLILEMYLHDENNLPPLEPDEEVSMGDVSEMGFTEKEREGVIRVARNMGWTTLTLGSGGGRSLNLFHTGFWKPIDHKTLAAAVEADDSTLPHIISLSHSGDGLLLAIDAESRALAEAAMDLTVETLSWEDFDFDAVRAADPNDTEWVMPKPSPKRVKKAREAYKQRFIANDFSEYFPNDITVDDRYAKEHGWEPVAQLKAALIRAIAEELGLYDIRHGQFEGPGDPRTVAMLDAAVELGYEDGTRSKARGTSKKRLRLRPEAEVIDMVGGQPEDEPEPFIVAYRQAFEAGLRGDPMPTVDKMGRVTVQSDSMRPSD